MIVAAPAKEIGLDPKRGVFVFRQECMSCGKRGLWHWDSDRASKFDKRHKEMCVERMNA